MHETSSQIEWAEAAFAQENAHQEKRKKEEEKITNKNKNKTVNIKREKGREQIQKKNEMELMKATLEERSREREKDADRQSSGLQLILRVKRNPTSMNSESFFTIMGIIIIFAYIHFAV